MKKKILSVAMTMILTILLVPATLLMETGTVYGATYSVASEYDGIGWNIITNCVAFARYKVPSLPGGLNSLQDKKKIINSYSPAVGSIAITKGNSSSGHVAYVEAVSGNIVTTLNGGFCNANGSFTGHIERIRGTEAEQGIVGYWIPAGATQHTHSYGSWTIAQQATCTAAGSKYRSCSCGNRQTETIPALGHSFGPYILNKSATCTEAGSKTRICGRCGKKETANITKLGHEFTNACDSSCNRKGCTYTRTTYHNFASTEWKYTDKLPAGISTADYEIQYNNTQTKEAASSPGTGWIKGAATTKYVNSGSPYDSLGIPLSTSDSRVLVKYSYYHYCGGSMGNYANFAMTGGFNHWDAITDPNSVTVVQTGTDGDDSRYTWYVLKWKSNGAYAYCNSSTTCDGKYGTHGNRSYAWYRVYTYQNKVKQTTYKWTKESGWTTKKDSSASAVKIRYRLRNYKLTAATPTANGKITTKCEICGEENATSTIPRIDAKSVALKSSNIVVKDVKGNALTINNDYTVMPTSDSGSFNINFCGNYSGTLLYTNKDIGAMKVKSLKLTAGKKKLTAKWDKTKKDFNSYQIRYSAKSNMSNAKTLVVNSTKATSKTISKLSAKKKYYVQIRRCKLINGYECYSPWSFKKSVKTK